MSRETDEQRVLDLLEELYRQFGMEAVEAVRMRWLDKHPSDSFVTHLQNPERDGAHSRRCPVAGCGNRVYAMHRYCTMHRLRLARTGDPTLARKRGPKKQEQDHHE